MRIVMSGKLDEVGSAKRASFNVYEDGIVVASVDGPFDSALRDAMRYAQQYAQDGGNIEVRRMKRRKPAF